MQLILNLIELQRKEPGYAEIMLIETLSTAGTGHHHEALKIFSDMYFWQDVDDSIVEIRNALLYQYSKLVTQGLLLLGQSIMFDVISFDQWALTILVAVFNELHETVGSNFSFNELISEIEAEAAETVQQMLEIMSN